MITVQIRHGNTVSTMNFPADEEAIDTIALQMGKEHNGQFRLEQVIEPKELKCMEQYRLDLDEMNFLAKRMDGFDEQERKRFLAAVKTDTPTGFKDLINLTYNLQRYTLVGSFDDMAQVGKTHMLCRNGCLFPHEEESLDFAEIGRRLIHSGTGVLTEQGVLFRNFDLPFEEIYDGMIFPRYDYNGDWIALAKLRYDGREEHLYMPMTERSVAKAVYRLGAENIGSCSASIVETTLDCEAMHKRLEQILQTEGLEKTNQALKECERGCVYQDDWEKLNAVAGYMNAENSESLGFLANHLDDFYYLKGVSDMESIAREWLEDCTEYEIDPDLEQFFDFEACGQMVVQSSQGMILSGEEGGFICMANDMQKSEIENEMHRNSQQMGEMQL